MRNDRNRLNAILQNMADALLVTDASERIQLTNPAFERLVRRSNRSLLGRTLLDVVPLPKLSKVIQQALAMPGMVHAAELTLVNPQLSGSNDVVMGETALEISVTALGDKTSVICVIRDITHEVEVDRMKSEFISTISHELRTPVTAILGFAKLTERAFHRSIWPLLSDEDDVQRVVVRIDKNLSIMVSEGETLTTLINDILDISALDTGTTVWSDQPYALVLLVQDVIERVREEAEAKGLAIETKIEADLPILIVDPARVEQVLGNLISNAIKFTERGMVMISAQRLAGGSVVHDWDIPAEGGIIVAVKDTGPGMMRQELSNIFQRFYQGGDTLNGKPSGTGLGLAISRDIVAHYGGEIWAESTLGVGSTFYFTLPLI
jgi:PAS domain S-box-containing protein